MKLSVVVVVYNMAREAPRTLFSLGASYQRGIAAEDYEVIVVDNGSDPPVRQSLLEPLAGNFELLSVPRPSPSPVPAVNLGLARARGQLVCVMIDGARIVSPGLLAAALDADAANPGAVITPLGWYLGFDFQSEAIARGYDRAQEDALLRRIDWPSAGYRLFEIAVLDESNHDWRHTLAESNALFLRREQWERLGGMDERFTSGGGGLANLDTFKRALESTQGKLVYLLGEGTFHQVHGGFSTNSLGMERARRSALQHEEYLRIRGVPYEPPRVDASYVGTLPPVGAELLELVRRLREEITAAQARTEELKASRAYRLTKPLRVTAAKLRALRKRAAATRDAVAYFVRRAARPDSSAAYAPGVQARNRAIGSAEDHAQGSAQRAALTDGA